MTALACMSVAEVGVNTCLGALHLCHVALIYRNIVKLRHKVSGPVSPLPMYTEAHRHSSISFPKFFSPQVGNFIRHDNRLLQCPVEHKVSLVKKFEEVVLVTAYL